MTKVILTLMILLSVLTVSCGKGGGGGSSSSDGSGSAASQEAGEGTTESDDAVTGSNDGDNDNSTPATIKPTSTLPAKALSFKTNVTFMNLTAAQKSKYNKAVALVKKVVGTEAFRKKVLNFVYAGAKRYANNNGKTNSQIYQSILDAAEALKPAKNNTMDLGVKMYYAANSVVGYTNPSITYINVNTKFFNSYSVNEVAGNLFHEWLHKLGYGHDSSATSKRPYSVPYAIGYMIRDLGKSFL